MQTAYCHHFGLDSALPGHFQRLYITQISLRFFPLLFNFFLGESTFFELEDSVCIVSHSFHVQMLDKRV